MTLCMLAGAFLGLFLFLAFANRQSAPQTPPTALIAARRPWLGDAVSFGTVVFFYSLLLLAINRFWSATLLGAGLIVLLWAGNRLKAAILSEVLVFSDVFLAGHALRYPRLYFGYAPAWIWPLLAFACGIGLWGMSAEEPFDGLDGAKRLALIVLFAALLIGVGRALSRPITWVKRWLSRFPLSFDPQTDAWAYTPLGAALLHLLWHGQHREELRRHFFFSGKACERTQGRHEAADHKLLIQAESFVPLHKLLDRPSSTPTIDDLLQKADSGRLNLDWRGAYTMRTEFAVLTGIAPRSLETYGFDPYRLAAMMPMESLAWVMKRRGYRTVVCHPNDGRFFERFRVMRHLGFDEFIDLERLLAQWPEMKSADAYCGRYVSDKALLAWASAYLSAAKAPTFLFVITMEAHGPWDKAKFPGAQSLTEEERYEVHLNHLDQGVASLLKAQSEGLDASVLMYGDHLPGLHLLRGMTPPIPSRTWWVAWSSLGRGKQSAERDLAPERLGRRWTQPCEGLMQDRLSPAKRLSSNAAVAARGRRLKPKR